MLEVCLILADDTSTSHKFLNNWPVQMPHKVWVAMGLGFPAKLKHMGAFSHMVGIVALVLVIWAADMFFREVEERMR